MKNFTDMFPLHHCNSLWTLLCAYVRIVEGTGELYWETVSGYLDLGVERPHEPVGSRRAAW
jgi:hypothetical protein